MKIFLTFIQLAFIVCTASAQFGFPEVIDSSFSIPVECISTSDVDNDGDKDLIVALQRDSIYWYKNNNSVFTKMQPVSSSAVYPVHLDIADANGDGFEDILVTNNGGNGSLFPVSVILYLNSPGAVFNEVIIDDSIDVTAVKSYFADIDHDGDSDIISCHDLEIASYENFNNDSFGHRNIIANGIEFYNMVVNDFTGDGFVDFVVHSSSGVRVYVNNQNSTFSLLNTITSDLFGFLYQTDLDNDGDADLIFPSNPAIDIDVDTNNGNGFFQTFQTSYFGVANQPNAAFVCMDLNGDLFADAVYCTGAADGIHLKTNDAAGHLISPAFIDSSFKYSKIFVDDIDGDSDNDIIWSDLYPFGARHLGIIKNNLLNSAENILPENIIIAFPNPFRNALYFECQYQSKYISIFDSEGRMVYKSDSFPSSINTDSWKTGKYVMKTDKYIIELIKQ